MKRLLFIILLSFPLVASADLSGRQKSFLYGVAGTILFQHINKNYSTTRSYGYVPGDPRFYNHGRYYGYHRDPIQESYERGLRDARRAEFERQRNYAYQCGRYGRYCDELR